MRPAALFLAAFPAVACAWQQAPASPPARPVVRAAGEAAMSAPPDLARLTLGVTTQAPTAQAAAAQNAKQLEAVLARLRKLGGGKAEIRTTGYSLMPNYRYPRDGGRPEIVGYTATNLIELKTSALRDVGFWIDAAVEAGANTIHNLQFLVRDEQTLKAQALSEATRQARANAEAMAAAAGVKILRVLSIEQGEAHLIRPVREFALARAAEAAVPTPVEPGQIEVRAVVTLTVEVGP